MLKTPRIAIQLALAQDNAQHWIHHDKAQRQRPASTLSALRYTENNAICPLSSVSKSSSRNGRIASAIGWSCFVT